MILQESVETIFLETWSSLVKRCDMTSYEKCQYWIIPDYLAKNTNHSDIIKSRFRAHSYQPNSIFEAFDEDKKKYDAFAQDIAVVHVFFDKMHSFSYKKSVKMTW